VNQLIERDLVSMFFLLGRLDDMDDPFASATLIASAEHAQGMTLTPLLRSAQRCPNRWNAENGHARGRRAAELHEVGTSRQDAAFHRFLASAY
jgi:hypothetical protein